MLEKNNELETQLSELRLNEKFVDDYSQQTQEEKLLHIKVKHLQSNEAMLIQKLNELITKRENLKNLEINELKEKNKKLNQFK